MKKLFALLLFISMTLLVFGCACNSAISQEPSNLQETAISQGSSTTASTGKSEIDAAAFKGQSAALIQFLVENQAEMEEIAQKMLALTQTLDHDDYVEYAFAAGELMHHQVEGQEETLIPVLEELKPQFSQLAVQENCLFQYCLSYPQVPLWGGNGCSFYYYTVDKNGFPSGAIELLYYSAKDGIQTNNLIWLDARWAIIEYE